MIMFVSILLKLNQSVKGIDYKVRMLNNRNLNLETFKIHNLRWKEVNVTSRGQCNPAKSIYIRMYIRMTFLLSRLLSAKAGNSFISNVLKSGQKLLRHCYFEMSSPITQYDS